MAIQGEILLNQLVYRCFCYGVTHRDFEAGIGLWDAVQNGNQQVLVGKDDGLFLILRFLGFVLQGFGFFLILRFLEFRLQGFGLHRVAAGTDDVDGLGFGRQRVGDAVFQPLGMALFVFAGEESSLVVLVLDIITVIVKKHFSLAVSH